MKSHRLVIFVPVSLLTIVTLSGCASLYSEAVTNFNKGYVSAKEVITDRAQAMDTVKRRKVIEGIFYTDEDPSTVDQGKLSDFSRAVCASSEFLTDQLTHLATLGIYNDALEVTNTKPKESVSALGAAIIKNWSKPEALKPAEVRPRTSQSCAREVQNLITLKRDDVPELAPFAVLGLIESATALYKALEKVTISILTVIEDHVRAEKIEAYVLASQNTVKPALDALNEGDSRVDRICQGLKYQPPCNPVQEPPTALDGVTIAQKWAALRKPWHLFLAMYSSRAAYEQTVKAAAGSTPVDPAPYWYLLDKQQDDLNDALQDYRTLAKRGSVGDIARAMSNANTTLVRLANGDLSPGEAFAVLKDFADRAKEVEEEIKTLKDATKSLAKNFDEAAGASSGER